MSGFWRTMPPELVRLPGVISVPSALRRMRLGPSDEKLSVWLADVNGPGYGPSGVTPSNEAATGVAAVLKAAGTELCPRVVPRVTRLSSSSPRKTIRLSSGTLEVEPDAN